jgi:outer membrane protein TolC
VILSLLLAATAFAAPAEFLSDIELFKQRSLTIRTNREALSAAGAATTSRLLQFTPKVVLAGGRERDKLDAPSTLYPYDNQYWYWRSGVEWNLFKGGGDYLSWRAARDSEASARFAVVSQELRTELDGANVIFRRLFLRDSAGAQAELLKLKQETLRIGHDRYQQGKIPLQDVMKMEVDLSQQVNVERQSEIDLAENEAAYRSFFVDELKTVQWPLMGKEAAEIGPGAGKSFEQQRLRETADALHFTWQAALTRHLPSVDFTLSYKNYKSYGQDNKMWSGVLELSVPLWSRYEISAASAQAYADSVRADDQARQNARDEELRRDFLDSKVRLSRANLEEARTNLDRANRLYRDMLRSFQLGRLSTNDLFLEQDRKVRAILSFSQARLDFHSSVMESCTLRELRAADCLR